MESQVSEKFRAEDLSCLFDLESEFSVISGEDLKIFSALPNKIMYPAAWC